MDKNEKQEIKGLISSTGSWNGGRGLIVPPSLARALKKYGFEGGYSESQPIPIEKSHD